MRILMLSWEYPPHVVGGLGRHVAELVPALAQQDIVVHVVTPSWLEETPSVTEEAGATVHHVPTYGIDRKSGIHNVATAVNQLLENYALEVDHGSFDLIHTHDWLTGFAAINLRRAWQCPLLVTIHATERGRNRGHLSNNLQRAIDTAERELAVAADHVIVCSRHMANEVRYFFQVPDSKLSVVPNGVNIDGLRDGYNKEELAQFRTRYVQADDQLVFSVARLVYEKGIHVLVGAIPAILRECPQARFVIAGKGPEGDSLRQQAENLDITDRVNFVGFVADEERNMFFRIADCCVFPSLYEPFGIVALEAMALGCPLVVSDVGGFAEVVKHADTGIKIYPDNVDSTAWGIVHALTHPKWARRHARRARRSVEELFNWNRIAHLTGEVYRQTLAEVPHAEKTR